MARGQQPQKPKGRRRAVYLHADPELYEKLVRQARKEHRSVSNMLAEIASRYFNPPAPAITKGGQ